MTRETGVVEFVEVRYSGGQTTAAAGIGATVLTLSMTVDFDDDGGHVAVNESTYDYVAVDHDTDTITLATPLTEAVEEDDPVRVLDALGLPEAERIAWVDLSDGDALPAEVPTSLAPYFPEGLAVAGQLVEVDIEAGGTTDHGVDAAVRWRVSGRPVQDAPFESAVRTTDDQGNIIGGVGGNGVVTARDFYYDGTFSGDTATMWWDGITAAEMLALLPKGLLRWAVRNPNITKIADTEYAVLAMLLYVPRDCEALLGLNGRIEATIERARFTMRVRDSYDPDVPPTPATNTSPVLAAFDGSNPLVVADNTSGVAGSNYSIDVMRGVQLRAGWHDLRWTFQVLDATATINTVGDFAMRVYDQGPALLANGAYPPVAPGTLATGGTDTGSASTGQAQFYTRDYPAIETRWYNNSGVLQGTGSEQFFGNAPNSVGGNRRSVIWFDGVKIARDLAGATVTQVEVYLYMHYGGSGNTIPIGSHTDAVLRNDYANLVGKVGDRVRSTDWSEGSGRWVDLPFNLQGWKSSLQGLLIGPAPVDGGAQYAGGYRGATHPSRPRLRVTFTR